MKTLTKFNNVMIERKGMPVRIRFLLATLAALTLTSTAQAQTYSAFNDFTFSSNPNGAWTYGLFTDLASSTFVPYDLVGTDGFRGGTRFWYRSDNHSGDLNPKVGEFDTATVIGNRLEVHPGPSGQDSAVRWTAPVSGLYDITGDFLSADVGDKRVEVRVNGTAQTDTIISGGGSALFSYSAFSLNAGQTIDFLVDPNGSYAADTTGLSAAITLRPHAVPEPGLLALLAAGLSGARLLCRRRK